MSWFKRKAKEAPCPHEWRDMVPVPPVHYLRECKKCGIRQGSSVPFERIEEAVNESRKSDH